MVKRSIRLVLSSAGLIAASVLGVALPAASLGQAPSKRPFVEDKNELNFIEKLADGVSFEMVAIPGGIYRMGSPEGELGRGRNEGPQHPVAVKPFWIGKCEVTWDEYDLYLKKIANAQKPKDVPAQKADAVSKPTPPYHDERHGHGGGRRPALGMTTHAAMEYCRWLSAKTGKNYRLPTEAEWEWACRAGTNTAYFFGNDESKLGEYAWIEENAKEKTHVVGTKKANPWGLHDVYGNVAEWCIDYYQPDFYGQFPRDKTTLQPVNLPRAVRFPHVVRGGSWTRDAAQCRSATRLFSDKEWTRRDPFEPQSIWWLADCDFVGFRVVRVAEVNDNLWGIRSQITRQSSNYESDAPNGKE